MKKEKGTAGPRRNGSSTRVRVRAYPARAAAENLFFDNLRADARREFASDMRISNARSFRRRMISIDIFPADAVADPGQRGIRPAFSLINLSL